MRLLLIQPRSEIERSYPISLAYISAQIRQLGHIVKKIDLNTTTEAELLRKVSDPEINAALISGSEFNPQWSLPYLEQEAIRLAALLKKNRKIKVFLSGPGPFLDKKRFIGQKCVDAVLPPPFFSCFTEAFVSAASRKNNTREEADETKISGKRNSPSGDVCAGRADWNLFDIKKYSCSAAVEEYPYVPLITSAGCSFSCAYCASPQLSGRKWVPRKAGDVADEMMLLSRKHGAKAIIIEDENLLCRKSHLSALCKEISLRGIKLPLYCHNGLRPDLLDRKTLAMMRQAGFKGITLSIESLSPKDLFVLKRCRSPKRYIKHTIMIVKEAKRLGFSVGAYFLIGIPGQTTKEMYKQLADARRLGFETAHFSILKTVTGSEFDVHGLESSAKNQKSLPFSELAIIRRRMYFIFYSQPDVLMKHIAFAVRHPSRLAALAKKAFHYLRQ